MGKVKGIPSRRRIWLILAPRPPVAREGVAHFFRKASSDGFHATEVGALHTYIGSCPDYRPIRTPPAHTRRLRVAADCRTKSCSRQRSASHFATTRIFFGNCRVTQGHTSLAYAEHKFGYRSRAYETTRPHRSRPGAPPE